MSKGKLLIFGVLAVILSGFSLFFINKQHQPSYDDFTKVIIKEYPALERDNKPVFSIVSTKRYGLKWHIVTIRSLRGEADNYIPVKLVVKGSKSKLTGVIGPAYRFEKNDLEKNDIPTAIKMELQKNEKA
jgi:hypothetical protein